MLMLTAESFSLSERSRRGSSSSIVKIYPVCHLNISRILARIQLLKMPQVPIEPLAVLRVRLQCTVIKKMHARWIVGDQAYLYSWCQICPKHSSASDHNRGGSKGQQANSNLTGSRPHENLPSPCHCRVHSDLLFN